MKNSALFPTSQKGAALAVSLIILFVLTLIGVAGMQNTVLEEKMSGNARDYNLAFQSAEVALRKAEVYIEGLATIKDFDVMQPNDGLISEGEIEPDYFSHDAWFGTDPAYPGNGSKSLVDAVSSLYGSQPRYIIKYVAVNDPDTNPRLLVRGYAEQLPGAQVTVFKVTARGTGGTNDSQVLLQTYVGKRF
ncbi:MAG: pilus assembly PilX family protein [Methylococcales bacterium]